MVKILGADLDFFKRLPYCLKFIFECSLPSAPRAPFFLLPCGFHSGAYLHISVWPYFRKVCPIHLHFLCIISVGMSNYLQFDQSTLLLIVLSHQIRNKRSDGVELENLKYFQEFFFYNTKN